MDIILNPTEKDWHNILMDARNAHCNQSWEWGEMYRSLPGMSPIRLLALHNGKPVALLQAFEWKRGPFSLGITSGGSGEGGGPVFRRNIGNDSERACYEALLTKLFLLFKEKHSLRLVIYTFPGDTFPPPNLPLKTATKCTPILRLPESEERFLHSLGHEGRREQIVGIKRGLQLMEGDKNDLKEYYELQKELARTKALNMKHMNTIDKWEKFWDIFSKTDGGIRFYIGRYQGKMVGALITTTWGDTCFPHGAVCNRQGKKLLVNNALHGKVITDAIRDGYSFYNMMGGTRNTSDPRYGITAFKLSFRAEMVDFRRYSATGNRYINFALEKIFRLFGRTLWFPIPIYP